MTPEVLSLLWGIWLGLLTGDVLGTVKVWNTAPALVDRKPVFPPGLISRVRSQAASLFVRQDPAVWEEISYSLAFHLRAGETPAQAVRGVSEERDSSPYLALRRACQGYDAGTPLLPALTSEARRSSEMQYLAGILEMGTVSGGDLPSLFCHAAEAMRRRRLLRGDARARLGEARATAVLLSLLPWLIGAMTLGRDRIARQLVLSDSKGTFLLAFAVSLWVLGNVAVLIVLRSLSPREPSGSKGAVAR